MATKTGGTKWYVVMYYRDGSQSIIETERLADITINEDTELDRGLVGISATIRRKESGA